MKFNKTIFLSSIIGAFILAAAFVTVYAKTTHTNSEPTAFSKDLEKHKIFLTCYQAGKMITYDTFLQEISPPEWAITTYDLDGNTASFFTLNKNGGDTMCKMQRKARIPLDAAETGK